MAISQAEFVLAVCLFAAAIFVYTHSRKLMLPLLLITATADRLRRGSRLVLAGFNHASCGFGDLLPHCRPDCGFQLVRYRWARWELGPWLLSASMLLLHLPWLPFTRHLPTGFSLMVCLLAGLSMLLIVFDDYKLYTRRWEW